MKIGKYKYKIALSGVDSEKRNWTIEWISIFNFLNLVLYNYPEYEYVVWKIYKFPKDIEI